MYRVIFICSPVDGYLGCLHVLTIVNDAAVNRWGAYLTLDGLVVPYKKCSINLPLGGLDSKESACNAGDLGLIPGLGRSHGVGSNNPLQYSCLENRDRGSWWATVHRGCKELDMTEQLTLSPFLIYIDFHIVFHVIYFIIFITFIKKKN